MAWKMNCELWSSYPRFDCVRMEGKLTGVGAERPAEKMSADVPLCRSTASSSATAVACGEEGASGAAA